jgi:DNA-directed RNA polymerase subunit RPC12/RpoP
MDVIFQCPNCEQELEVDSSGAGSEINCPSCGETIVVPEPGSAARPKGEAPPSPRQPQTRPEVQPINPIAASAAAKEEKHFQVPVHDKPAESLIARPLKPLEVSAKDSDKTIRVKTVRRIDCVEVGHDRFDEVVTGFLHKIGEDNIVSVNTLAYTYLDIGTQKLLTDYGVLIVYRG